DPISHDGVIRLWDSATGALARTIRVSNSDQAEYPWTSKVVWSPDGRALASQSDDYTIRIWDPQTGELKHALNALDKVRETETIYQRNQRNFYYEDLAWSPDG